ncbi:hypothetical protein V6N13_091724 [Hibiscus sabdariffa]
MVIPFWKKKLSDQNGVLTISFVSLTEHCCQSFVCDVILVTIDDQNGRKFIGDVDDDPTTPIGTDNENFMTGTDLKALLLSSPAFHADT